MRVDPRQRPGNVGYGGQYGRLYVERRGPSRFGPTMSRSSLVRPLGRLLAASALALAMTAQPTLALNATSLVPGDPAVTTLISAEQALLDLTNADRVANGLEPLELDLDALAVARDREAWRGRLGAVITLAAPVHGCSVGALINWAWLVMGDSDGLGEVGRDLDARWKDAEEQARLARRAAFLRHAGARVVRLPDPDDSVVRPEEALLPAPGERASDLQVNTQIRRPGSLGHGALLDEPAAWRRVLAVLGPQAQARRQAADPIEQELKALKERMRREGRLK